MNQTNNYIKISGLLYILISLFFILYIPLLGGPFLIIGVILLANSFLTLEELNNNKVTLIIIAILSILLNQLAAILLFISIGEISSAKKDSINSPPEGISSESKKIDLLLKLGLAMILIAGILFATTSWDIISDLFKLIALIIMGIAFLGLSKFSEIKLKIASTTKAYFILGLSFFILTWVGIGYFAPFSTWFSYHGEGSALVYCITFLLTALAFYIVNSKFKDRECIYLGHASTYLSIFMLLTFFKLSSMQALLIMNTLSLILNIIPRKKMLVTLQEFNRVISFLYWPIILTESFDANFIVLLITSFINIFNIIYIAIKNNDNAENLFATIISYILIFTSLVNIPYDIDALLAIFIVMTVFSLILKYNPFTKNKFLIGTSQIIYHIISMIIIFIYLDKNSLESMMITGIYLIANIINSLDFNKTKDQVDFRYQPFVIFYFIFSVLNYFDEVITPIDFALVPGICAIIYTLINFISKKDKVKNYYSIYIIIATILTYVINLDTANIIAGSIALLTSAYIHLNVPSTSTGAKICSYIFVLLNIQSLCLQILPNTYGSILTLLIYILLILVIKDKKLDVVNYLSIVVPLTILIESIDYQYYIYQTIALNILRLYILFLVLKYIIKSKNVKDIVATIFYSLIISGILFQGDLVYGLYIGILTTIVIFITFNEDEYRKLFYASIIITIINIIVQLWEYWGLIPFWLYLLIVGIGIVVFVTYKELNKSNNQTKSQAVKRKEISNDELLKSMNTFPTQNNNQVQQNQVEQLEQLEKQSQQEEIYSELPAEKLKPINDEITVGNFCPTCGTPNKGGKFCAVCGRNLIIKK